MLKLYFLSGVTAFGLSFVFCLFWIPFLRKWNAGQNILSYVKEHKKKNGTPTMGGIAFVSAAVLTSVLFVGRVVEREVRSSVLCLLIGVAYMIIGLLDDFLKIRRKENLGLRAWQKLAFQSIVAIFCGIYCYRNGLTELEIPFIGIKQKINWWIIPISVFVFLGTVNAVNLTDGLDGLAAGTSIPFFLIFGVLITLQNGDKGVAVLSFSLVGALLAYLVFNVNPASVFMGDTGSLALGGFASAISVFTGNALYVAVVGACFVASVLSVILQVAYFKVTGGKRILKMAPIHHHFQQKGYSESRIAYAYFAITLILGIICVLFIL